MLWKVRRLVLRYFTILNWSSPFRRRNTC
jgi:hypothetical protein